MLLGNYFAWNTE
ncbi:UNVERIFIED_CONTAM: hypothetical protein GTU68_051941 [Idotea baltica]|nr:hypothetical protein [Idotea baltica]